MVKLQQLDLIEFFELTVDLIIVLHHGAVALTSADALLAVISCSHADVDHLVLSVLVLVSLVSLLVFVIQDRVEIWGTLL